MTNSTRRITVSNAVIRSFPRIPFAIAAATASLTFGGYVQPARAADATTKTVVAKATSADESIRPFKVHVPQAQLDELRRRINATRWPDRELVDDGSQGIQTAQVQELVRYWGTKYDWRKAEAQLNALPQFVTKIDGLDIHFIHVRSRNPNALPLILTHGWPGSIFEFINTIGPLTDPEKYGGKAEDAFDVVIPSIPGYGFSGRPTELGWQPERTARAWDVLMKRLGYTYYVSQGGDHGSVISDALARQAPAGLRAIHLNMPATVPGNYMKSLLAGDPAPAELSPAERDAYQSLSTFFGRNAAYGGMMVTRPQTIGYSLSDSPSGLAAWTYEKIAEWSDSNGMPEHVLTRDAILNDITLYWLTNTGA
ncbi:MAG: alpha/beta fold hydrolase, partial [Dyella sp.]|nr:alpha/beta fold hydrolase [Dyella sp.]